MGDLQGIDAARHSIAHIGHVSAHVRHASVLSEYASGTVRSTSVFTVLAIEMNRQTIARSREAIAQF